MSQFKKKNYELLANIFILLISSTAVFNITLHRMYKLTFLVLQYKIKLINSTLQPYKTIYCIISNHKSPFFSLNFLEVDTTVHFYWYLSFNICQSQKSVVFFMEITHLKYSSSLYNRIWHKFKSSYLKLKAKSLALVFPPHHHHILILNSRLRLGTFAIFKILFSYLLPLFLSFCFIWVVFVFS